MCVAVCFKYAIPDQGFEDVEADSEAACDCYAVGLSYEVSEFDESFVGVELFVLLYLYLVVASVGSRTRYISSFSLIRVIVGVYSSSGINFLP